MFYVSWRDRILDATLYRWLGIVSPSRLYGDPDYKPPKAYQGWGIQPSPDNDDATPTEG